MLYNDCVEVEVGTCMDWGSTSNNRESRFCVDIAELNMQTGSSIYCSNLL
jgi:hypothetical protein